MAAFGDRIWVAGGFGEDGRGSASTWTFSPGTGQWAAGPQLPSAVHHAALVAAGSGLYLLGGYSGSAFDHPTAAVWRLDTTQSRWIDGPSLPSARAAGAAAWDGQRIVYGGGVGSGGVSGNVFALENGDWRRIGALGQAREHLGAASDGAGHVWFLGGRVGTLTSNLATVDLVAGSTIRQLGSLPTPRGGVAGFWTAAHGACLVGGEAPSGTIAAVECIDENGVTARLPSLGVARHGLGVAMLGGTVYAVMGGKEPGLHVSPVVEALTGVRP